MKVPERIAEKKSFFLRRPHMKAVIDRHKPRRGSGFQLLRKNSRIDGIHRGKK